MWYGKIAIIMVIFSFALTWGMYEITGLYNPPGMANNWTFRTLQNISGNYSSIANLNGGQNPSPALIFGDFITGVTVLLNALAVVGNTALGGGLISVLQGVPGIDANIQLIIQIIYGSSETLLWIYVVANRSL